jgi:outer membrane protein TolC
LAWLDAFRSCQTTSFSGKFMTCLKTSTMPVAVPWSPVHVALPDGSGASLVRFASPCLSIAGLSIVAVLTSGCLSISPDRGFGGVTQIAAERLGADAHITRTLEGDRALQNLVSAKLEGPLLMEGAVQIALLNNRALQAVYWDVGIAQADLVQAARLQNPAFTFQRTRTGGDTDFERSFALNLMTLLTAPLARRVEAQRFEQTTLLVGQQMINHAVATKRAWLEAVGAQQAIEYAKQVNDAAMTSAQLMERMTNAGNASQLDLAREQAFQADSAATLAHAAQRAAATRELLIRALGLDGNPTSLIVPERLPDLPLHPFELADAERLALGGRLDLQAARLGAQHTATSLGLTRATRIINVLDLEYVRNTGESQETARGYGISIDIPLFDWGTARVARAEAIYMQDVNRVAQAVVDIRSEARLAYLEYRSAYDLARHYRDQVIPLRKKISDETMLRYNGMLTSVFALLADSREQSAAVNAYIAALKDFGLAQVNLEAALGGRLPSISATPTAPAKGTP